MLDVCAVLFTFLNQGFRGEFFFLQIIALTSGIVYWHERQGHSLDCITEKGLNISFNHVLREMAFLVISLVPPLSICYIIYRYKETFPYQTRPFHMFLHFQYPPPSTPFSTQGYLVLICMYLTYT